MHLSYLEACLCLVGSVGLGIVLVLDLNVGLGLNLLLCFIHVSCSSNVVILGLSVETILYDERKYLPVLNTVINNYKNVFNS